MQLVKNKYTFSVPPMLPSQVLVVEMNHFARPVCPRCNNPSVNFYYTFAGECIASPSLERGEINKNSFIGECGGCAFMWVATDFIDSFELSNIEPLNLGAAHE